MTAAGNNEKIVAMPAASISFGESAAKRTVNVTKSNALIEASYRLTLQEQRLILNCIGYIDSRLPLEEQRIFRITAHEFQARFGLPAKKAYEELKTVADRLFERKVILRDPERGTIDKLRWVSKARYVKGQGAVELHFAPEILPYLSQIKERFTSYSLDAVANFSSTFAIRLYELLGQYRTVGKRTMSVADLRHWLDCSDSFDRFTDFERFAIKVAVDQINEHSDLRARYQKIKQGRSVTHLEFTFTSVRSTVVSSAPPKPKAPAPAAESREENERRYREQMKMYGMDPDSIVETEESAAVV